MIQRLLWIGPKWAFIFGLILTGAPILGGGQILLEHLSYAPTQATVLAVTTKCEMRRKVAHLNAQEEIVECADVPAIRSRQPEITWTVDRIPVVTVTYPAADSRPTIATMPLRKLSLGAADVGQVIPVLRSPDQPGEITMRPTFEFYAVCAAMLVIGLLLLGLAIRAGFLARFRHRSGFAH